MVFDLAADCLIRATEDDVYQIVQNLAENGIKYNVEGGTLYIRLDQLAGVVRLTVGDTGIGIPAADLPHIFERFYRVDKARSSGEGGSGLGLSIVQDTVRRLGGRVEASRRADGGTIMRVTFPAA
ncbi:MAG: sensor histidine kinase [Oscillospiraceae bacterium]|nr:sensor histidine kinase [Oscillospiraceae bacterium]